MTAVVLCLTASAWAATIQEAQQAIDAKKYPEALQAITQMLNAAKPGDKELRYDLYMLRGEAMLQLGSRQGASDAFKAAQRNTADVNKSCIAQATLLLLGETVNFVYTSPRGDGPLDIRDPAQRTKAFSELFDSRFAELQPRVFKQYTADNLSGIIPLLPDLGDAYAIERAATGKDEKLRPVMARLGDHARDLVGDELDRIQSRVEALESISSEPSSVSNYGGVWTAGPRGLVSTQKNELADTAKYLMQIRNLCQHARETAARMGGPADKWDALATRCDQLADQATALRDRS